MNLREIHKIYNGLENKDMPREEFVKQVQDLTSQAGVNRDLGRIIAAKQTQAIRKQEIDRAIENN
ncbi:unnamed protein product [marine sediment metagenome]|uniref:Uncharacterized protein n=1 Tax=marine sediment metagenome TaxID=412755 RepID=X1AZ27_9ZZZZ